MCVHIYCLKYLDLTLISANAANSIVAAQILSTRILGEVFILKYDLPALIFICLGCVLLVLNANTEQSTYTAQDVRDLLSSTRTICFFAISFFLTLLSFCILQCMLRSLRRFEIDVEDYERELAS